MNLAAKKPGGFDFDAYTSLGQILLRAGKITEAQLRRALSTKGSCRIGDALLMLGFCSAADVLDAASHQKALRPRPCTSSIALSRLDAVIKKAEDAADRHGHAFKLGAVAHN